MLSLFALKYVPTSSSSQESLRASPIELKVRRLILTLFAVLVYNAAIVLAWANLFLIGMEIKPDEQTIANTLLI